LRQVVTYHVGMRNMLGELNVLATRAAYGCTATACMSNELFPGAGVAFTTGSESRMIVTFVDATGVVLAEVVMGPDRPARDLFVERTRTPAASTPDRLVVGQFDDDGELDMAWNISARRGTKFEVAYARKVGDQRLAALSGVQTLQVTSAAVADLTGDGNDDVVITGDVGVVVVPMHAPAQMQTVPTDSACAL
jgi:hypothetical protein